MIDSQRGQDAQVDETEEVGGASPPPDETPRPEAHPSRMSAGRVLRRYLFTGLIDIY